MFFWTNLFNYRELLFNLAKKELKVKYKNSVLGFFWSLLNPILMMLIFSFVLGVVFKDPKIDNFPIFFLAGLLPWNFFNNSIQGATGSIVANAGLIKKVYFPRELLPLAIALANLVNFFLELVVFFLFISASAWFFTPRLTVFYKFIPYLIFLLPALFFLSVGLGFITAAINVYLRDMQHIVGIILMVLFYATPIIYRLELVPPAFLPFYKYNPLAVLILSFKNTLYWMQPPTFKMLTFVLLASIIIFAFGYFFFLKLEGGFAEEV